MRVTFLKPATLLSPICKTCVIWPSDDMVAINKEPSDCSSWVPSMSNTICLLFKERNPTEQAVTTSNISIPASIKAKLAQLIACARHPYKPSDSKHKIWISSLVLRRSSSLMAGKRAC
jgi:hypothetical protein